MIYFDSHICDDRVIPLVSLTPVQLGNEKRFLSLFLCVDFEKFMRFFKGNHFPSIQKSFLRSIGH